MPIRFACTVCGTSMSVPAKLAGRTGRCTKCKATVSVPQLGEPGAELTASGEDRPLTNTMSATASPVGVPTGDAIGDALEQERLKLELDRARLDMERAELARAKVPQAEPVAADARRACPDCGEQILVVAKVCRFCGRGKPQQKQRAAGPWVPDKDPMLAVVLSAVFPGAGQAYVDGCLAGIATIIAGCVVLGGAAVINSLHAAEAARAALLAGRHNARPLSLPAMALVVGFYAYVIWDAHRRAAKQRARHRASPRER